MTAHRAAGMKLSASHLEASLENGTIQIHWKVENKEGMAKIWLGTTNNFKTGGKDVYTLVKEVPVANGKASIDIQKYPSAFYKLVLEMPYNVLNRWIAVKK